MQSTRPTGVFIVDDSASIRARLAELLVAMGDVAIVGEAASAPAAVDAILRVQPDSVLLDLDLGGSSGMDVLRSVVRQAPGIVFVILTNHSEAQYRRACRLAGAAYFLDKSTEFARISEVITEIAATRH